MLLYFLNKNIILRIYIDKIYIRGKKENDESRFNMVVILVNDRRIELWEELYG